MTRRKIVVDLRVDPSCFDKKVYDLNIVRRLERIVARVPDADVFVARPESNHETLFPNANRIETDEVLRQRFSAPGDGPLLEGNTLYLPANVVCRRHMIVDAFEANEPPVDWVAVRDDQDLKAAHQVVLADSFKTTREAFSMMHRRLSWPFTRTALKLGMSPNAASFMSLVVCLAAGYFAVRGQFVSAAIAFWFSCVFDVVDGTIARMHVRDSPLGSQIDNALDGLYYLLLIVSTSAGLYMHSPSWEVLLPGALVLVGGFAALSFFEVRRRQYGYSTSNTFNMAAMDYIRSSNQPVFMSLYRVLHLTKRHSLPYIYLGFAAAGKMLWLLYLTAALVWMIPPVAQFILSRMRSDSA